MNYTLFSYSSSSPSCYLQLPVIRRTTPFWYPQHYSQSLWNILYIIQLPVVRQTTPPPCCPQHYSQCWWNILSYQTWCLGGVLVYRAWLKKIVGQLPLYCNQAVLVALVGQLVYLLLNEVCGGICLSWVGGELHLLFPSWEDQRYPTLLLKMTHVSIIWFYWAWHWKKDQPAPLHFFNFLPLFNFPP